MNFKNTMLCLLLFLSVYAVSFAYDSKVINKYEVLELMQDMNADECINADHFAYTLSIQALSEIIENLEYRIKELEK